MLNRRYAALAFVALVTSAFAIKAPFAARPFRQYADSIAYVNIARNVADGHGFTSSLKLNYFDTSPVSHCALSDWPPLYPLLCGALMELGVSETGLQVTNALLASIAAGLIFLIGRALYGMRVGLVAGAFAALSLSLFRAGLLAISDALGLVLVLSALLVALAARSRRGAWFLAGGLCGLAYLTRFPNAVVFAALLRYTLTRKAERSGALACVLGFLVPTAPVFAMKWLLYGSPLHSAQAFHYATTCFRQSAWECGSPPTLSLHSLNAVAGAVWRNTSHFGCVLLANRAGLFLLSLGLPVAILAQRRQITAGPRGLLLAVAALNFGVYGLTWSLAPAQGARFMLVPFAMLLPFCAAGIVWAIDSSRAPLRAAAIVVCALTIIGYCTGYPSAARHNAQFGPLLPQTVLSLKQRLPYKPTVASNNPCLLAHQLGLPSAALPHNLGSRGLAEYVSRYGIEAVVIFRSKRKSLTLRTIEGAQGDEFRMANARDVRIAIPISDRYYGQNAYDGILKPMPQMVHRLPTMHSPSMMPRKSGSACR